MRRHPRADEGELSWMRQVVVNRRSCAAVADAAGLPAALAAAAPEGERDSAGDLSTRAGVRSALAEAVIGAAWLELGPEVTRAAVLEAFAGPLDAARPGVRDAKTALQEEAARRRLPVAYELIDTQGPPQARTFTSRALVGGRPMGEGSGSSKQESEQEAAARALAALGPRS